MKKDYYVNNETGELVSWNEMMAQMAELYDGNYPISWLSWEQRFTFYKKMDLEKISEKENALKKFLNRLTN